MAQVISDTSLDMNSIAQSNLAQLCATNNFVELEEKLLELSELPRDIVGDNDNILCYVLKHIDNFNDRFMSAFLAKPVSYFRNVINVQNGDGQTPAVIACLKKRFDVIDALKTKGAMLNNPTKNGEVVVTATATEASSMIPRKITALSNTVRNFSERYKNPVTTTLDFTNTNSINAKDPATVYINDLGITPALPPKNNNSESLQVLGRGYFDKVKDLAKNHLAKGFKSSNSFAGGEISNELSTESFIRGVIDGSLAENHGLTSGGGGKRSVVVGQRIMNQVPSYSSGGSSDTSTKKSRRSKKSHHAKKSHKSVFELSRVTNDIHDKTVQSIMEILGVNEDDAKLYKSMIYHRVKNEHPEYSGYERAVEMQKLATKDVLKDIDIATERKRREDSPRPERPERSESPRSEKREKKPKKEYSDEKKSKEKKPKKGKVSRPIASPSSDSDSNSSGIEFY